MGTMLQDLRYAVRTLWKSPGFTTIAVIALALGIGANTAMFSIVNGVLLRPIPYPKPQQLLKLYTSAPQFRDASVSYPNYLDWQQRNQSFEAMAAYRNETFNLTGQGEPERLRGLMVSAVMFNALGVKPILGHTFTSEEDRRGAAPVVVLTSSLWKTRFGGDPNVIGRGMTLTDKLYTIIGVVPDDDVVFKRVSVMVPIGQWAEPIFWDRSAGMGMRVVGRLKQGVSPQQAQSELDSIAAGLAREYPKDNKDHGISSISLRDDLVGDVRTPLLILLGAVGFVLLIACANVANLLLARSTARRREFAIRGALGATQSRVVRQLLTEGLVLAFAGGALALAVASGLHSIFVSRLAAQLQLPRAEQIRLDSVVLAFTAAISILASLLFSITPALQSARLDLNDALKEAARGNTGRGGFQRALVVTEVALALVLTASAGLMIRTISHLWSVNPGLDPHNVLNFEVAGSQAVHGTPTAVRNGFAETGDRLRSIPGVEAVSLMFGGTPLTGSDSELWYWVEGRPKPERSQMDLALFYGVSPDYFKVMRIPLLRGRLISQQDNENSPCAVDVDEEFAKKAFPGENAVGQHINVELINLKCEVIGVVGHVKHWGLDVDATSKVHSQMYIPARQFPDTVMDLVSKGSEWVVRTAGDPYALAPAMKRTISDINGRMVMFGAESMEDNIKDSLSSRRFTRLLLGVFAVLALVLAAVGIYGVVSYTVTQATHDIGVRMALGADARQVLGMVIGDAMKMAVVGIVIGVALGFAATRAMKGLLFGVSAADPLTFTAVAVMIAGVTALASYIPARRATQVDPTIALRVQ
jgi:predicted permease